MRPETSNGKVLDPDQEEQGANGGEMPAVVLPPLHPSKLQNRRERQENQLSLIFGHGQHQDTANVSYDCR